MAKKIIVFCPNCGERIVLDKKGNVIGDTDDAPFFNIKDQSEIKKKIKEKNIEFGIDESVVRKNE